jgi:hypothetical protein
LIGPLTILDLKNYDLYFLKNCLINSFSQSKRIGPRVTAFTKPKSLVLGEGMEFLRGVY